MAAMTRVPYPTPNPKRSTIIGVAVASVAIGAVAWGLVKLFEPKKPTVIRVG
jgi:hypothetical protein